MAGKPRGRRARPKGKSTVKTCTACQGPMPTRDQHDACLMCQGLDHAVLAANKAGSCSVCKATPLGVNAKRLRQYYDLTDGAGPDEDHHHDGGEPPQDVDPSPEEAYGPRGRQRSPARGDGARSSPPQHHSPPRRSPPPLRRHDQEEEDFEDDREGDDGRWDEDDRRYDGDEEEEYEDDEEEEEEDGELVLRLPPGLRSSAFEDQLRKLIKEKCEEARNEVPVDPPAVPPPPPQQAEERPPAPPPMTMDDAELIEVFKEAAVHCRAAWPAAVAPSAAFSASIYRDFGGGEEPPREKQILPLLPGFLQMLKISWEEPKANKEQAGPKPDPPKLDTANARKEGLEVLPPMDRLMAAHLLRKAVPRGDKEPVFETTHEQNVSKHVKAAYGAMGTCAKALNAMSMLQISTSHLLRAMKDEPSLEQLLKLRRLHNEQLKLSEYIATTTGRAMAQMVYVERNRWLNLSCLEGKDRDGALYQKISPTDLFSASLPDIVTKHKEEKEQKEALNAYLPTAPRKPAYPRRRGGLPYTYDRSRERRDTSRDYGRDYGRGYSRDRYTGQRPAASGAQRAPPPAAQQPTRRRVEKRRQVNPDPSPAGRGGGGGGRGASARGAYGGRQRK